MDKYTIPGDERIFEVFGTPDSIILDGNDLNEYFNPADVNVATIGLVYNLDGCKLILSYYETFNPTFWKTEYKFYLLISDEAFKLGSYMYFGEHIELWNKEEGYTFD